VNPGDDDAPKVDKATLEDLIAALEPSSSTPPSLRPNTAGGKGKNMKTIPGPGPEGPPLFGQPKTEKVLTPRMPSIELPHPEHLFHPTPAAGMPLTRAVSEHSDGVSNRLTPEFSFARMPSTDPASAVTTPPTAKFEWLAERAGILGYAHSSATHEVIAESRAQGLAERLAFVRHLARGLGTELSLETLHDVHIHGKELRVLSTRLPDGGTLDVEATAASSTHDLALDVKRRT
jgi:hypothetical protein